MVLSPASAYKRMLNTIVLSPETVKCFDEESLGWKKKFCVLMAFRSAKNDKPKWVVSPLKRINGRES